MDLLKKANDSFQFVNALIKTTIIKISMNGKAAADFTRKAPVID